VGVSADEHVNTFDFAHQLHVLGETQMRAHDDEIHTVVLAQAPDMPRQFRVAEREPNHRTERGRHGLANDRRRDAHDADPQATPFDHPYRREGEFSRRLVEAVYYEERVGQAADQRLQVRGTLCEIPMPGHRVKAHGAQQRQQAFALGPHDGIGAVEGVAVVEQDDGPTAFLPDIDDGRSLPDKFWVRFQVAVGVVDLEDGDPT
jgi:hypothetical protein